MKPDTSASLDVTSAIELISFIVRGQEFCVNMQHLVNLDERIRSLLDLVKKKKDFSTSKAFWRGISSRPSILA